MMYPYLTFADGTQVVHSDLIPDSDGGHVLVHFERPTEAGFDSVRFDLPTYAMTPWEGDFTEEELDQFRAFLRSNAHLLYRYAESWSTPRAPTGPCTAACHGPSR